MPVTVTVDPMDNAVVSTPPRTVPPLALTLVMVATRDPLDKFRDLYHFTDVRNIPLIKALDGIHSTAKLNEMDVVYYPGGDALSLALDAQSGMDKYVHLCFARSHPMAYRIKERNNDVELCYLTVDRAILHQDGVQFSPGVGYAAGVEPVPLREAVDRGLVDFAVLYTYMWWGDADVNERRKKAELCEILVPKCVPIEFIKAFPNG